MIMITRLACPRCIRGYLYPDEDGRAACLNCGWLQPFKPLPFVRDRQTAIGPHMDRPPKRGA